MNIRILLATVVLFFSFQSIRAQDTIQPVKKHAHKTHMADSSKASHSSHTTHIKDTSKIHKEHSVFVPKYPRSGYVAIMGGPGLPVGAYSSEGFATSGSIFSISAAFPGIISHYGFAFKFDYGTNGINQNQFLQSFSNAAGITNLNYSEVTLGDFSYKSFLTGLYITYPAKHLSIDLRILMGVMIADIPSVSFNLSDQVNGNSGSVIQSQSSGAAFAIDFGMEARYAVKPKLSIILSVDYLHAAPSFPEVVNGITFTGGNISEEDGQQQNVSQAFSLFNLSIGVGYTISAKK